MPILDVGNDGIYTVRPTVGRPRLPTSRTVFDDSDVAIAESATPIYSYKEYDLSFLFPISSVGSDAAVTSSAFQFVATESYKIEEVIFECDPDVRPSGSTAQIDVTINGTSIFSTNPTIDAGEYTSETAATPPVLTNNPTNLAVDDIVRFDIDQVGSTAAGQAYKVTIMGYKE